MEGKFGASGRPWTQIAIWNEKVILLKVIQKVSLALLVDWELCWMTSATQAKNAHQSKLSAYLFASKFSVLFLYVF